MRAGLHGLPVAHPIGERLPGVYAEDDFAQRMTSALDDVLAPVFATLDCFPDYLYPILAPADFVDWLSGWVAFSLDEGWTLAQRRALVANAVELHRWRGTTRGLAAHVRLLTLGDVQIVDSGSCTVSSTPTAPVSSPDAHVEVRVAVADPRTIDEPRLLSAIAEAVPAHVTVSLTVSVADPAAGGASGRASARASVRPPAASGSASVPLQAPSHPEPDGMRTGQLQQPGAIGRAAPPSGSASVPVSAPPVSGPPASASGPPTSGPPASGPPASGAPTSAPAAGDTATGPVAGPPRQAGGGRVRGVARPPSAPADPSATRPPGDSEGPR
jgi:phage tail-like protein